MKKYPVLLGVDTGGTFTDFFALVNGELRIHKVLSTPHAPEKAILQGIAEMQLELDKASIVHGSTVATNAVLEGKTAEVAYITNAGFEDVLTIGRQARKELYNLAPEPVPPPVSKALCFGLNCRIDANGAEVKSIDKAELHSLVNVLKKKGIKNVAINFLFSWKNACHEEQLKEALSEFDYVCASSDVLAEYREYERGVATWINAGVGPLMRGYLDRLESGVTPAQVSVMQSMGGTLSIADAGDQAVRLLLSGPAGGLNGAKYIAGLSGIEKLLTFDMGGTSTDVAVIDGDIRLSSELQMAGYPVSVPMVDMHTIGAGGGSIAFRDQGGLLQVGPESAGASPGPAAYGNGGELPTVTDANVYLGRIPSDAALGGSLSLDFKAAEKALSQLSKTLSIEVQSLAEGVIRLANEHMAAALRVISVEKGMDLEGFTLTCFGGAGGLHVCALAELMGLRSALVPVCGGVLSALGMLAAPESRETSQTINQRLSTLTQSDIDKAVNKAKAKLADVVLTGEHVELELRYVGQSSVIRVAYEQGDSDYAQCFEQAYFQQFGYTMDIDVELVTIRVTKAGEVPVLPFPELPSSDESPEPFTHVEASGLGRVPCYQRSALLASQRVVGPAIIVEAVATTWVETGWRAEVDKVGNILLSS